MKALVIGYKPFYRYHYNTCERVVEMLNGSRIDGFEVIGITIPVSLSFVRREVPRILEEYSPEVVLGLGMAPRSNSVLLELVAANIAFFEIPDNDGYRASGEKIFENHSFVLETSVPIDMVLKRCIHEKRLRIRPSISLGTYLCNALAYVVFSYARRKGAIGGFLHLPPYTDIAMKMNLETCLPLYEILEAVECVLKVCIECYTQRRLSELPNPSQRF